MKRPWKAFVRDVGPTFSFATGERAHARAETLTGEYAEVLVYCTSPESAFIRTVLAEHGGPNR